MKIDAKEMHQLAQAGTPRLDLYGGIHKALRAMMADTLLAVGRMDCRDDLDLARTTERVLELLDFCVMHLTKENTYVHPAMEARAPGSCGAIAQEHEDHIRHIDALAQLVAMLRDTSGERRFAVQQQLYAELTLFVADNFQHMRVEETAHNAVLWERYTDEELGAIHDSIIASIPPDTMLLTARWLVPFMSPMERAGLLGDMRRKAPAPAFQAVLAIVRPHLSEMEWAQLERDLA